MLAQGAPEVVQIGGSEVVAERLQEGLVRGQSLLGRAPGEHHGAILVSPPGQFRGQARLPDPRVAGQDDDARRARGGGRSFGGRVGLTQRPQPAQRGQLFVTPDQHRLGPGLELGRELYLGSAGRSALAGGRGGSVQELVMGGDGVG